MIYVDTSAFLAVLNADDDNHAAAKEVWVKILESQDDLVCNSYVLVETYALIQHRLGIAAARAFHENILPILEIKWLDAQTHREAANVMLTANRRDLSLVDCSSFVTMRQHGIRQVFTFDKHFFEQGFAVLP